MKRKIKILKIVKNFFFPPRCIFCDRMLEINAENCICDVCKTAVKRCADKICCEKCGKPIISYGKRVRCYHCVENKTQYFDRIVSVYEYDGPVVQSVHRFKGGKIQSYAITYAECMSERLEQEYKHIKFDLICATPSSSNKKLTQGFDNVELICKYLSAKTGIPLQKNVLKKIRRTKKQTELNYQERAENVKNSIAAENPDMVYDKTVLLVDDICTTRATLTECSRALKKVGAKRVYCLTFATAIKKSGNTEKQKAKMPQI